MITAIDLKAASYRELNIHLFGQRIAGWVNLLQFFMLIGVTGVMLSGTGALFDEHFNLPGNSGILLTIAAGFIVVKKGVKGLLAVNVVVVPLMIIFHLRLAGAAVTEPDFLTDLLLGKDEDHTWRTWLSPLSYTALNLALAQAVLVPLASEVNDKKVIKRGAFLGGGALMLLMLASHACLIQVEDIASYEIPMAYIVEQFLPAFHYLYAFLIYGEIFTSVIGNAYGLKQQMSQKVHWPPGILYLIIFSAGFLLSQISYGTLLGFLYPIFGCISLVFLFLLWKK